MASKKRTACKAGRTRQHLTKVLAQPYAPGHAAWLLGGRGGLSSSSRRAARRFLRLATRRSTLHLDKINASTRAVPGKSLDDARHGRLPPLAVSTALGPSSLVGPGWAQRGRRRDACCHAVPRCATPCPSSRPALRPTRGSSTLVGPRPGLAPRHTLSCWAWPRPWTRQRRHVRASTRGLPLETCTPCPLGRQSHGSTARRP